MGVIKNLFHVSLQVNDYKKSLDFYCGKLGFEQMFELNIGQFKDMLELGVHNEDDQLPWLTYLRIAPDQYLEMFNGAINPPEFKKAGIPAYTDSPMNYFALGTGSMTETETVLREKGIEITDGFFKDPDGIRIQIVPTKPGKSCTETKHKRIFHSLAGLSLFVNDIDVMSAHLEKMTFQRLESIDRVRNGIRLEVGEYGQFVELIKADEEVITRPDDVLGHFAVQIYNVADTVKAWGANGVYCCPQPFQPDIKVPADDTAKGNIGLDGCEIIWMLCPEGNKIEVMVEPETTLQQRWEREHPF